MQLLAFLTNAFPSWALLASVAALRWPWLFTWFTGPLITIGLGVIMLGMGVTLTPDDFRRVAKRRRGVATGAVLQYTIMPLTGWGIAWLLDLPTPFAVGLILVASCPGGTGVERRVIPRPRGSVAVGYDDGCVDGCSGRDDPDTHRVARRQPR